MHLTLAFVSLFSMCLGQDTFFAVNKVCEGWFCETEHLDLITFTSSEPSSFTTLTSIYPSSQYNTVEQLTVLHTYDPSTKSYFCVVQDPAATKSTLWSYSLETNKATQVSVPYGAATLDFDPNSKALLATYAGFVYYVSPQTGLRKPYFEAFPQNPSYSTIPGISFWHPPKSLFSELVFFRHADPAGDCYFVYIVDVANNKTTISECFADNDPGSSLGEYETLFIETIGGQFFAVTYDVLGANYQFLYPQNYTVIKTVLDFQDFAGIGWEVGSDSSSFTYDPLSKVLWAPVVISNEGSIINVLGAVSIPSGNTEISEEIGEWTNIQVIYGQN